MCDFVLAFHTRYGVATAVFSHSYGSLAAASFPSSAIAKVPEGNSEQAGILYFAVSEEIYKTKVWFYDYKYECVLTCNNYFF